uniref:NS n=1 Tax=Cercospora beticola negative-stranded virus 4-3 TaxID=2973214 RepID=A0A976SHC9_9MONO|nr:NS [Cercospora beticola negative-stranded virus 4-3]
MSPNMIAPLLKKQMIESQTPNGKCYLRLICVLPSFPACDPALLEEVIVHMTLSLRSNPKGLDVLHSLWNAEKILLDEKDSAIGIEDHELNLTTDSPVPLWFIESIMSAPFRFGFEDRGGVMHVTYYLKDTTDCQDSGSEIETELGFASRFILQMMCNQGRHIGATIDLDDIFCEMQEEIAQGDFEPSESYFCETPTNMPPTPSFPIEHNIHTGLYDPDPIKRETQSRLEDVFNRMEGGRSTTPDKQRESKDHTTELLERMMRMEEKMNSVLSINKEQTVTPDDSSSNIGRYEKKFMKPGTVVGSQHVYNHTRGGTMLAIKEENLPLDITKDVAVGFVKTKDMRVKEIKQLTKIAPINGLANPFKSSRLNMLMHFHTAVHNVMPKTNNDGYIKMMNYLLKYKPKCASEEFAFQLIIRTFDMNELVVVANPFKLPFIEVGMQITDSTLVKCFTLLENEYRALWFDQLKHLHIPAFHDEFSEFSTNDFSKRRSESQSQSSSKSSKQNGYYSKTRGGRSVMSIYR